MALSSYALKPASPLRSSGAHLHRYQRRADLIHSWGLMTWHAQVWHQVARLTGERGYDEVSIQLAAWMAERQLECDEAF